MEVAAPDMVHPETTFALLDVLDIPTIGEDARKRIAVRPFDAWLRKWKPDIGGIERAQSMSYFDVRTGQRRAQANNFNYGRGVGAIEATAILAGVRLFTIEPGVWKKVMGVAGGKDNKGLSRDMAVQLFPQQAAFFKRVKDHNRAEAVLLAKFTAQEFLAAESGKRGQVA